MYDIFFLSYNTPDVKTKWKAFRDRFPTAHHVSNIDGIFAAHKYCSLKALTSHFYVVDADNEILDFDFKYKPEGDLKDYVHVWHARNPVNGLEYGWGGLKLFPKTAFENVELGLDMTTSFPLHIVEECVSITHFDETPYDAWRSAFREAVKLSLQDNAEAAMRLKTWQEASQHGEYAHWVRKGVEDGIRYYGSGCDLTKINDWAWLKQKFSH